MIHYFAYHVILPIEGIAKIIHQKYVQVNPEKRAFFERVLLISLFIISLVWMSYFMKIFLKNNEENSLISNICLGYLYGLMILVLAIWITVFMILLTLLVLAYIEFSRNGWEIDFNFLYYCDFKNTNEQEGIQIKSKNTDSDRYFLKFLRKYKLNVNQLLEMNINRASFKKGVFNNITTNTDFADFVEYLENFKIDELSLNFKKYPYFNTKEIAGIFTQLKLLRTLEFSFPKWQHQNLSQDFYLMSERIKILGSLENLRVSYYPNFPTDSLEFFTDFFSHLKNNLLSFTIRIHPGENAKSIEISNYISVLSRTSEKFERIMSIRIIFKSIDSPKGDDLKDCISTLVKIACTNKQLLDLRVLYSVQKQGLVDITDTRGGHGLRKIFERRNSHILSALKLSEYLKSFKKIIVSDILDFYI